MAQVLEGWRQGPALHPGMGVQAIELLLSGLRLDLALGRDPGVRGYLHDGCPPWRPVERPAGRAVQRSPAGAVGRPCPTAAAPPDGQPAVG